MPKAREFPLPVSRELETPEDELLDRINRTDLGVRVERGDDSNGFKMHLGTVDLKSLTREIERAEEVIEDLPPDHIGKVILERIAAIGSYGISNGRRVYAGFDEERKVKNRKEKERRRGPYFYARDHNFSSENVDLPEEFENTILCGDAKSTLQKLPDNCVDIVVTSPPYNFGLEYEDSEDGVDWSHYLQDLFAVLDECVRVLKFGGRILINVQPLFSDYIPLHHLVSNHLMSRRLIWKGEILWEKNNYNCKYTAWGSWKSPSSPYLKYTWEFIEVFTKGSLKKKGNREDIDITADEFKDWVVAKWSIAPERRMDEFGHPAMFPEELVRRCLKLFSYQGDVVLDPYNGVGTTTSVADQLDRRYIGIDISGEYCETARKRLARQISLI